MSGVCPLAKLNFDKETCPVCGIETYDFLADLHLENVHDVRFIPWNFDEYDEWGLRV